MAPMKRILLCMLAILPITEVTHARSLELQIASGSVFGNPPGLSALPSGVTETPTTELSTPKTTLTADFRVLIYPFGNSIFAFGLDFPGFIQGAPKINNANTNMSGYTEYMVMCTSSDVVVNFNFNQRPVSPGGWWTGRYSLLAMGSVKANCDLIYHGTGKLDYHNTAEAQSYGAALHNSWTLLNFLQLGFEGGYRFFKSRDLIDPDSQPVVDTTGQPVSINLSGPYLRLVVGLEF